MNLSLSLRGHALSALAAAIAVSTGTIALAEEASDQAETDQLETLVVVGEMTNTVVEPEQLEQYQANDLSDVFRHVPSVDVGGSLGIAQKIYIRGLEDSYINITVDGAPQTGTLFHHIGRVSIEPELLKAVEVQAGAGEATSGAGTIGGAIRFITKDPDDLLRDGEQFGGKVKAGYFSNDGHRVSGTLYGNLTDNWGLLGSYVSVDRDNMEDGDGNELFGTSADQTLGYLKLSGQLTDSQRLSLSYEKRDEEGDFGARPNWPTLEGDLLFPMEAERETYVANYHFDANEYLQLQATAYYTSSDLEQDRYDRWGRYGADISTYGFDLRNTSTLGQHNITYGVDYRSDEASSEYLAADSVWQGWAWDPTIGKFEEEGTVKGAYIQDHWQLFNDFLLSFGVRYDSYDLDQVTYNDGTDSTGVSPNIGFAYDFAEYWRLSMGYAEAMRGKEVGDAFTLEHNPAAISLQPGLDPEEVKNKEIGLEYDDGQLFAKASVYRMDIDDVIYDQLGSGPAPQDDFYYENIGNFESDGIELLAGYNWDKLTLTASYSKNDSEINGHDVEAYEYNGLGNSRGDTYTLSLNYNISEQIEMGWYYTYVDSLSNMEVFYRVSELGANDSNWVYDETQFIDKPSYDTHDIYLRWTPLADDSLTLDLAVINLFNEQYRDHSSVGDYSNITYWEGVAGLYEPGRNVRLTVGYTF